MHSFFITLLCAAALVGPAGARPWQKKQAKCEQGIRGARNWEMMGQDYVYFDYVICPADVDPPAPLVRVWITTRGKGIALEKWTQDREGADSVVFFEGEKRAYTLFRDLKAVPLKMLSAEGRSGVPADMGAQPFMAKGLDLIPARNLAPDSAERAKKVFENADAVIKKAQAKTVLLYDSPRIVAIVESLLDKPLKAQK